LKHLSDLENIVFKLRVFIIQNRNRDRVAELSGLARNTISGFVNDKHEIRFKNLVAIDKAVTQIKLTKEFVK